MRKGLERVLRMLAKVCYADRVFGKVYSLFVVRRWCSENRVGAVDVLRILRGAERFFSF